MLHLLKKQHLFKLNNSRLLNNKKFNTALFSSIVDRIQLEPETPESIERKMELLQIAHDEFAKFDQEQVDKIFHAVAHAASRNRVYLAKLAVAETQMGLFEDKVIKNTCSSELTLSKYEHSKTVGIIESDPIKKITKMAVPLGPIASLIPVTNPTSTVVTKSLFALKTRNAMCFIPHLKSPRCTSEAVRICCEAAVAAGAPPNVLQMFYPSRETSKLIMHHKNINLLVATGGPSMVQACYESGKPAIGVGAGNAAVLIDETANVIDAVGSIVLSKTFDNGVICASEQSVVMVDEIYDDAKVKFQQRGVYFLEGEDKQKLREHMAIHGHINPAIVGQSAKKIAADAGIGNIPEGTVVLAAEIEDVGMSEPLSGEKLSPLLSFFRVKNFEEGCLKCKDIVNFGGKGHSSAIHTQNEEHKLKFADMIPAFHMMVNMPTALGAIGTSYNFNVDPSMTLGVGSIGGSSMAGPLTPFHLLDVKTIAEKQEHIEWFKNPPAVYFNRNCTEEALDDLSKTGLCKRALIVSDKVMEKLGHVARVQNALAKRNIVSHVFSNVNPDPDMKCIRQGIEVCKSFEPGKSCMLTADLTYLYFIKYCCCVL